MGLKLGILRIFICLSLICSLSGCYTIGFVGGTVTKRMIGAENKVMIIPTPTAENKLAKSCSLDVGLLN